jgi:hypothetical protein
VKAAVSSSTERAGQLSLLGDPPRKALP